ncbi:MAG TPA: hypothetical protein VF342_07605 [Alphaproteobacteria bacterium]
MTEQIIIQGTAESGTTPDGSYIGWKAITSEGREVEVVLPYEVMGRIFVDLQTLALRATEKREAAGLPVTLDRKPAADVKFGIVGHQAGVTEDGSVSLSLMLINRLPLGFVFTIAESQTIRAVLLEAERLASQFSEKPPH